ncbi:dTDP-4-dehydrorhamnose reductase [Glaciecola sp. 33A]|jgi:dTDP-4-dehydrorhamnose reductase|uniref:dTDP-4-dehydrorhamnose reductase n=1 Tax=Glaciecola sp. 33A TaxID=2057807 RepID=UPI000C31ED12|nr:dTDP-4-dehydrorhamnose reductase [Glaciecola sp. 33A]PKI02297.1 dTDP-4-dehydrorhamnose reductase [Glaciecola sp. 33A]
MLVIIGKNGQLAKKCLELVGAQSAVCLGRDDINITADSLIQTLDNIKPSAIINASAYTAVDLAESEENKATAVNYNAVERLSDYCKQNGIHFVHVSTDYVFKGDKGSPYLPGDNYDPINVYGKTKMLGEQAIQDSNASGSCVLRTSWVYSEFGGNFVASMLRFMDEKEQLTIISDQIGCPTSVDTLARACIASAHNKLEGIHHVTDEGVASWFDFAKSIQRLGLQHGLLSKVIPIKPINTADYPTPAKRPHYSVLSKDSFKAALPLVDLPYWEDALESVLIKIKEMKIQD